MGETKTVELGGKGKISLVVLVSRSDTWVVPELWAACIEKFLKDYRPSRGLSPCGLPPVGYLGSL